MVGMTYPVVLVGGGPGAWDLVTLRGARALENADIIFTDHLGPTAELDRIIEVANKEIVDVSKLPYGKSVAQEEINRLLVEAAQAGKRVARLKGGDPYIFGRGYEELEALAAQGIACEVIPGVSSATAVPAAAGIPLTHRGVVHSFTVVSGHLAPDNPKSLTDWAALSRLAQRGTTVAVIMGVRHVAAISRALIDAGLAPNTPAAAISEGTTARQNVVRATASTLPDAMASHGISAPAVYVFGQVASFGS